jgi:endonuclease YncB( thermonuclease family)
MARWCRAGRQVQVMGMSRRSYGGRADERRFPVMGEPREARRTFAILCRAGLAGLALAALPAGGPPGAAEIVDGPVAARVLRVIDGDTIEVAARIWLGQRLTIRVRLAGVDAPEMRGRCDRERNLARAARELVASRAGESVRLTAIRRDKYGGRVVARVAGSDGHDLSDALLSAGLAHRYEGRRKLPWCETARR